MRLLGKIHKRIVSHDDSTSKKGDDARKSDNLAKEIANVAIEKNEASLFERIFNKRLVDFEEIT